MSSSIIGVEVEQKTTKTFTMRITGERLLHHLREAGYTTIPNDARATFQVPGGGDWSNETVEIDDERIITVTWVEHA